MMMMMRKLTRIMKVKTAVMIAVNDSSEISSNEPADLENVTTAMQRSQQAKQDLDDA
jgi:hypothetical protein